MNFDWDMIINNYLLGVKRREKKYNVSEKKMKIIKEKKCTDSQRPFTQKSME